MVELPFGRFGAILADPPWHYRLWAENSQDARIASAKYDVMSTAEIAALPVGALAKKNCVLFVWVTWPQLTDALRVIEAWGFKYKTCAFAWLKADGTQPDFWKDEIPAQVGMGYWTRANSEVCLLATRGKPKRQNADVRQGIIEPRREHSRKPDCVAQRIERLVEGPYLELFARTLRPGWTCWGNETEKFAPTPFDPEADARGSYDDAIAALRERHKRGEPVGELPFFKSERGK